MFQMYFNLMGGSMNANTNNNQQPLFTNEEKP